MFVTCLWACSLFLEKNEIIWRLPITAREISQPYNKWLIFQRFLCWYLGPLSGKKDEYPVLTFDAKLAYQDENDTNWKQMAEAIEDRELKCELHSISVSELTVLLSFAVNRSDKENHIVSRIPCRSK